MTGNIVTGAKALVTMTWQETLVVDTKMLPQVAAKAVAPLCRNSVRRDIQIVIESVITLPACQIVHDTTKKGENAHVAVVNHHAPALLTPRRHQRARRSETLAVTKISGGMSHNSAHIGPNRINPHERAVS